jgi:SAM-dependent methyltransferase
MHMPAESIGPVPPDRIAAGAGPSSRSPAAGLPLREFAREHVAGRWYTWAMENYKSTLLALVRAYGCRSLLEVGGGRAPLLGEDEVRALGIRYTVNDISEAELKLCPAWADKVCFDIAGAGTPAGAYDLIFSRMVLEHVQRGERAYRNIHSLLRAGGIGLNFHPTLFAPPFVINLLLPSALSEMLLRLFGAYVTDADGPYPKFPAKYSLCRSTAGTAQRIKSFGFSEVFIAPFYGHGYFRRIPLLGAFDDCLGNLARNADFRPYTSYAYSLVRR